MAYGENAGKSGVVYILREMDNHHKLGKRKTHLFKIGESTRSGKIRAIELTTEAQESGSNVSYEFITESRTQDCYGSEQLVFKKLEEFRLGSFGEWGGNELFEFIDDNQLQNAIKVISATCTEVDSKLNQETWLDELIVWADEKGISEEQLSRDKQKILAMTKLELKNNQLTELPEFIEKLTNLTYLDLSNNQLSKLPESIGKLTNLTELNLSNNQLTKLPESISQLTKLTKLDLSDNPIKSPLPEPLQIISESKIPEEQQAIKVFPEIHAEVDKSNVMNFINTSINAATKTVESVGKLSNAVLTITATIDAATTVYAEQINAQLQVISKENKAALALLNLDDFDLSDNPIKSLPPEPLQIIPETKIIPIRSEYKVTNKSDNSGWFWMVFFVIMGIFVFGLYHSNKSVPAVQSAPTPYIQPALAYVPPLDFNSYPINTVYNGKIAPVILNTADKKRYRTRLRAAVNMPADFAGEYVFVRWECGMRCIDGAVVSHKTGHVVFLPANVCCWFGEEDLLQFQLDSSLLIANGSLNEGVQYGKFFYEFNGREFKLIHTQLLDREEAISKSNEEARVTKPPKATYAPAPMQAPIFKESIVNKSADTAAKAAKEKFLAEQKAIYLEHEAIATKQEKIKDIKPEIKEVIKEIPPVIETKPEQELIESEERKKDRLETQRIFDEKKQKAKNSLNELEIESEERKEDRLETQRIFDEVKEQKAIHSLYKLQKDYEKECHARGSNSDACKSLDILYEKGYQ